MARGSTSLEPLRGRQRPRDHLSLRQQQVLDAVPVSSPAPTSSIARTAGIGLVEVRSTLAQLQGRQLVAGSEQGWRLAALGRTDAGSSES